jgi:hypothetical protein
MSDVKKTEKRPTKEAQQQRPRPIDPFAETKVKAGPDTVIVSCCA